MLFCTSLVAYVGAGRYGSVNPTLELTQLLYIISTHYCSHREQQPASSSSSPAFQLDSAPHIPLKPVQVLATHFDVMMQLDADVQGVAATSGTFLNTKNSRSGTFLDTTHSLMYLTAVLCTGDQAFLTPRRLSVVNTSSGSRIKELAFSQAVLAVRLNKQRYDD